MSGAAPRLNPLATGDTQLAHTLVPGQMVDIAGGRVMEVVDVPDRLLAPLLGEGGATLEEIRRVSGASIEMIEMVKLKLGDAERRAIVTGVRTIVAHAVKMIADVLANPTVMVAQPVQATVETRVIEIPFNKAGLIIGRAGETIRDIMSKSGAHVQVSREATGEDEETRTVTIQGTAEQIESAAAHVNSKLNPDDWQLAVKAQNAMRAGFSGPLPAPASLPMHSVGAAPPPPPGRAPAPSAAAAAADPKVRETALRSLAAMARAILGDDGRETRKADAKADAKAHGTNAGAGGADGKSEEGAGEASEEGEGEGEGESEAVLAELQLSMSVGGVMSLLDDGPVAQLQASGVELHLAKLPSRGQRAVKLSGEATAVETVAAFLRACDARAARRQKRRRPLAPQDAARRYYDRYYEEGGIAYRPPQRLWHEPDAEAERFKSWAAYYREQAAAAEEQQREAEEVPAVRRTKKKSCGSSGPSGGASAPPAEAGPAPMPQAKPEQGGGEAEHALPEGWQKGVTPDGRDYFYNVGTGATQWIRPNDY